MNTESSPFLEKYGVIKTKIKDPLPHWQQDGKLQFITFRLSDSLPASVRQTLTLMREDFIKNHPEPLNTQEMNQLRRIISKKHEELLDNGYGACILRLKEIRKCVDHIIHYFDNKYYIIFCYVIMPNHVHLLIRMLEDNDISKTVQAIKRNSSRMINQLTGKSGRLWMDSYYDRIIRNNDHYKYVVNYIRNNPRFLSHEEYSLYFNPDILI